MPRATAKKADVPVAEMDEFLVVLHAPTTPRSRSDAMRAMQASAQAMLKDLLSRANGPEGAQIGAVSLLPKAALPILLLRATAEFAEALRADPRVRAVSPASASI